MNSSLHLAAFAALLALASSSFAQDSEHQTSREVLSADLEAHVRYLASDELAGRKTGTPENIAAAHYLAAELEGFGLQPAGDDGSFLQAVPFQRERYTALPELEVRGVESRAASYGADFIVRQGGPGGEMSVKLVRVAEDIPSEADAELALCFIDVRRSRARTWLKKAGHPAGAGFGLMLSRARREYPATTEVPSPGRPHLAGDNSGGAVAWVEYGAQLGEELAAGEVTSIAFDLHYEMQSVPSYNVIARLPGTGSVARPELADEAIVVSAHYDHLGVGEPRAPKPGEDAADVDLIYNGADDDASGVACVLEIAEAMAAGTAPAREVIFLLATAEEIGIVGTTYYLDHPPTPLERTVCNLNFEMIGRPDEKVGGSGKLWFTGAERTNLMKAFQGISVDIVVDPYPSQNFFARSDNIVFVYRGIVGQTFSTYNLHEDYHTVKDEADALDFEHMQGCTRAGLRAVELVASGAVDPEWLEGMQPKRRR